MNADSSPAPAADPDPIAFDVDGIRLPIDRALLTDRMRNVLSSGAYERGELRMVSKMLRPDDRVLELGAGIGLISTRAATIVGPDNVTVVEANPDLIPQIARVHGENGVAGVRVINAVAGADGAARVPFYRRADFWSSSLEPDTLPYVSVAEVPGIRLDDLLAELRPTVIVSDIEGAEAAVFAGADLTGVRLVLMETHPKVYGQPGVEALIRDLAAQGLAIDPVLTRGRFLCMARPEREERAAFHAARGRVPADPPRIAVMTCMKNEGPFILEWLAFHRAIGVTDFLVFTNDCTDGTVELLDALDRANILRHVPNPATLMDTPAMQPVALDYAPAFPMIRDADYLISMDVDEFINVRIGEGRLSDLFAAVAPFDVLSMSMVAFGTGGVVEFREGWVTEQFRRHEDLTRSGRKSYRGVKSIILNGNRLERWRNHRPDLRGRPRQISWLDGSGRSAAGTFMRDRAANGFEAGGAEALVALHHYQLRSRASFLVKSDRGGVVRGRNQGHAYFRKRELVAAESLRFGPALDRARAEEARLRALPGVAAAHDACVAAHHAMIARLRQRPDMVALEAQLAEVQARRMAELVDKRQEAVQDGPARG